MYRGRTLSLSFPPFTPWVKRIVIACAVIYFLQVLLHAFRVQLDYLDWMGLVPYMVMHGCIWQLVTYSLLHASVGHVLINMLMLWMFGAQEEMDWGSRKFLEFYVFCVVGAALTTIAVAYFPIHGLGLGPVTSTIGASGGVYGVLMAFGMLYGDREIIMFPLPFMMKAKYMVAIMIFLVIIATFDLSQGGIANFAHLGGLFFGFLYVKFVPRQGLAFRAGESYFGFRNSYYRWKRRRTARKFEVYMRRHNRTIRFDEHGNYIPPDEPDKKNGGSKSGWVN
jgi:membrane associated rhomboid family serine protease